MPDISMYSCHECPSRQQCYRYMAVPNPYRQAYGGFRVKDGEDACDAFWLIEEGRIIRQDVEEVKNPAQN